MKKSSLLILIGGLIAVFGAADDRFIHMPPYVVIASMLVGIACLLVGYGMTRAARTSSAPIRGTLRLRDYFTLLLAVGFGVIVGFFDYRTIHRDGPMWISVASCVIALVLGAVCFYWDIFIRDRSNS